ncbi:MAG: glutamate-1-semialdehyde 2,1-aminomutase [Acidobacteriota bacterium]|nr:glutamate-1-semialdehyde 2,1-aminomutase [Acidobacteriota bacterium]
MTDRAKSRKLYGRACELMPAGVNSPVRAFRSVGGDPLFYQRGLGCHILDADGNRYIDYICSWGPLILGHAYPDVVEAVATTAAAGLSFGAPCRQEVELADLVVSAIPHLEMVRFVSSGTEAVMSAIRLARGVTRRDTVVKFSGCYHGHADHLLVSAGSGLATFGTPSSAGVPESFAAHTAVLPLDDDEAFLNLMEDRGDQVAAVIIEGVPANAGLLVQRPEFMRLLRDKCTHYGALLILDEVITGFRLGANGAAFYYGIEPDLATYGKVIGGGMPVGAYGGRRDLMEQLAPLGPVYQAGTLSGNPVAMAAGAVTLQTLLADAGAAYAELEKLGAQLEWGLREVLSRLSVEWSVVRVGSILWLALQGGDPPRKYEEILPESAETYAALHRAMLDRGILLAPSAYEVMFVSLAHDPGVIEETIAAFEDSVKAIT